MITFRPLAAVAAMLLASPALALAPGDAVTFVTVHQGDLDLNSPEGVDASNRRIDRAAREACGPQSAIDLHGNAVRQRCIQDSRVAAIARRDMLAARSVDGTMVADAGIAPAGQGL